MKRILSLFAIAAISLSAFALQPQRGYRGFIDWDNNLDRYQWVGSNEKFIEMYTGVSTSHGYQFNPNFYLGAGVAVQYNKKFKEWILPVFMQVRTDQKFGKFTPFGDIRIGYSLTDGGGIYFSPMIGYRFNWGRKMGINVGVGLTLIGVKYTSGDLVYDEINGYFTITNTKTVREIDTNFSFKIGIDF